jgi:hypothetical protein
MTSQAFALCVGVNSVDPKHYSGWSGPLAACEYDANDMTRLLSRRGFDVSTLLTAAAKRDAVLGKLRELAGIAKPGDVVCYSNSSHGGQLPDLNADEDDGADETLCMFDGEIVDDELALSWSRFKAGVRIVMISDSCHSGTVSRLLHRDIQSYEDAYVARHMPSDVAVRTYNANQAFYDPILSSQHLDASRDNIEASVLLISGCMDNQTSLDGFRNGLFTSNLLRVWNGGKFTGSYRSFRNQIARRMPTTQTPNFYFAGKRCPKFEAETPFTIGAKLDLASVRGVVPL